MSSICDIKVMKDYIRMCSDGVGLGWHERNGGNLTYRMTEEEVSQCRPFFRSEPGPWTAMGVQADNLKGEYFISTGSGKFLRNVELEPQKYLHRGNQRGGRLLAYRVGTGKRRKAYQ